MLKLSTEAVPVINDREVDSNTVEDETNTAALRRLLVGTVICG